MLGHSRWEVGFLARVFHSAQFPVSWMRQCPDLHIARVAPSTVLSALRLLWDLDDFEGEHCGSGPILLSQALSQERTVNKGLDYVSLLPSQLSSLEKGSWSCLEDKHTWKEV